MPEVKSFICISCPRGCQLTVDIADDNTATVSGNSCPLGERYGKQEAVRPMRTVTTTVKVRGAKEIRCPAKTEQGVDKDRMQDVIDVANRLTIEAPVKLGQVLIEDVAGTGSKLVATRSIAEAKRQKEAVEPGKTQSPVPH